MFTGKESHDIPLAEAAEWTANFRDTISEGETIAHLFGKEFIQDILNQENCVGIRFYYALDENEEKQLIIVGVDANENDLYEGKIGDRSFRVPPHSGSANPLNS